jgi:hypothetical protein
VRAWAALKKVNASHKYTGELLEKGTNGVYTGASIKKVMSGWASPT